MAPLKRSEFLENVGRIPSDSWADPRGEAAAPSPRIPILAKVPKILESRLAPLPAGNPESATAIIMTRRLEIDFNFFYVLSNFHEDHIKRRKIFSLYHVLFYYLT